MEIARETTEAPARPRGPAPWPAWKIVLAYAVMFLVALGSIRVIDGHVMRLAAEMAREAGL